MADVYEETEETRTYTKRTLIRTECDRCGAEIPEEDTWDTRELDLRFTTGTSYPEGGHKLGWQVEDLCDDCLSELKTWLKDWGAKIIPYEIDW